MTGRVLRGLRPPIPVVSIQPAEISFSGPLGGKDRQTRGVRQKKTVARGELPAPTD